MATRIISQSWKVGGVLTDVTHAKLSDPTGTYGVKRNDTSVVIVPDGTDMTHSATGVYEYSFTDEEGVSYTAYVEFVYAGATYHLEVDIAARASGVGAMLSSYSGLLERVGHALFGIRTGYTADQTTDIEECITDGLKRVYQSHTWSFFRPIQTITTSAPYSTGTITIASGVVTLVTGTWPSWAASGVLEYDDDYYDVSTRDSNSQITLVDTSVTEAVAHAYELGRPEYSLPTGFEAIEGDLTYEPGQSDFYPPVTQLDDGELLRLQQDDPYNDRPIHYSIRTGEFVATTGSTRLLALHPTPDAVYVLKARMKLKPTMIDVTNLYPIGGETLTPLITAACLAAAERNYDEQEGLWEKQYQELLAISIANDQLMTSPTSLGRDAPADERRDAYVDSLSRSVRMGAITLNGTTL